MCSEKCCQPICTTSSPFQHRSLLWAWMWSSGRGSISAFSRSLVRILSLETLLVRVLWSIGGLFGSLIDVPERVRSFAWHIMHGKLPTKVYCSKWSGESSNCYYCAGVDETIIHVLRDCPLAVSVWRTLVPLTMRSNFFGYPFDEWTRYNIFEGEVPNWRSMWAAACFYLWGWRNKKMHDPNFTRPFFPAHVIQKYVNEY